MSERATVTRLRPRMQEPKDEEPQSHMDEPSDEGPQAYMTVSFEGETAEAFDFHFLRHAKDGRKQPALLAMMDVLNLLLIEQTPTVAIDARGDGYALLELMPPLPPFPA